MDVLFWLFVNGTSEGDAVREVNSPAWEARKDM
jgi:hypothetical protein